MLTVLDHILELKLPPARWSRLAEVIELAISAAAAADPEGLRQAATELEMTRPIRIIRIGDAPLVPAPAPARERIAVLQGSLRAAGTGTAPGKDKK